ncbi:hypothetical protein EVJ50_03185 [Synechococcus sp. RSCCF101]|uniref:hypothetical protein n=1 Tax=Synechococcus sp. RSCCF101 TaxID=2511069 RepID=UPI001246018A|nr:hypothetical protein [Synechococcus sp. RSCCF101]QEY31404.1 hypothetical protein EVJ50_03185 [Synechococcus sp. RSCCF101]
MSSTVPTDQPEQTAEPSTAGHCGSSPRRVAIGIAPLGFISIGIVPMGVITIGVVPMGVVSVGVVAMGVINAAVVGMGVLAAGWTTMGVWTWSPAGAGHGAHHHGGHGAAQGGATSDGGSANTLAYPTRAEAEQRALEIGCEGVHRMGNFWMPCSEHPE